MRVRLRESLPLRATTRLDDKLVRDFMDLVEGPGLPFDGCCDYLGVSPSLFWAWLRRGEKEVQEQARTTEDLGIHGQFYQALRQATAAYRTWLLDNLHHAGQYWTKWMTELERRDRPSFSRFEPKGGELQDANPDDAFL